MQVRGQAVFLGSLNCLRDSQRQHCEVCIGCYVREKSLLLLTESQPVLNVASDEYIYNLPLGNIFDPPCEYQYFTFGLYRHSLRYLLAGMDITNSHQHHGYSMPEKHISGMDPYACPSPSTGEVCDMKLHCTTCI